MGTLADIRPGVQLDLHWPQQKNSARNQGAVFQNLFKPARAAANTRRYVAGDPVNMVDWKAFARTDQLLIREHRDEAALRVSLGIDLGATMKWPTKEIFDLYPTKLEVALRVGFTLANIFLRQGDLVSLNFIDGAEVKAKNFRSSGELISQFEELEKNGFEIDLDSQETLPQKTPDLGIWLGDLLSGNSFQSLFSNCKNKVVFHLLSDRELDISWVRTRDCYFDEGRHKKEFQGFTLLQNRRYERALKRWRTKVKTELKKKEIGYFLISDATPIANFQSFLNEMVSV